MRFLTLPDLSVSGCYSQRLARANDYPYEVRLEIPERDCQLTRLAAYFLALNSGRETHSFAT